MTARLRSGLVRVGVTLGVFAAIGIALVPQVRKVREAAARSADL